MQFSIELDFRFDEHRRRHNTRELIFVDSKKRMIGFVAKTLQLENLSNTPFAPPVVILLFMKTPTLMNRSFD